MNSSIAPRQSAIQTLMTKVAASRFITVSLLIHLVLIIILGGSVLYKATVETPDFVGESGESFIAGDTAPEGPPEAPEQAEETPAYTVTTPAIPTAAPLTALTAAADSTFSLPAAATAAPSGPTSALPGRIGGGGGGGLPDGLSGLKQAGTSSFFGVKSKGNRIAFLVDYSKSMKGGRDAMMRKELAESLKTLDRNAEVVVLFFSGPLWIAGEDAKEEEKKWEKTAAGNHDYGLKKGKKLGRIKWLPIQSHRKKLLDAVEETPLTGGTDWRNPFNTAFDLSPLPDVIFFMTDGSVDHADEVVKTLKRKNHDPNSGKNKVVINTIALGEPRAAKALEQIAKDSGGGFREVEVK